MTGPRNDRPAPRGRPLDILTPGAVRERWLLLCPRVYGVWLHWLDGRTVPCPGEEECEYCREAAASDPAGPLWDAALRWKGYLAAWWLVKRRAVVVEITEHAWRSCAELERLDVVGQLRGRVVGLVRRAEGPRGRVYADLEAETPYPPDALPPCPDVKGAVARLWQPSVGRRCEEGGADAAATS